VWFGLFWFLFFVSSFSWTMSLTLFFFVLPNCLVFFFIILN
jgi:hypothetical protein